MLLKSCRANEPEHERCELSGLPLRGESPVGEAAGGERLLGGSSSRESSPLRFRPDSGGVAALAPVGSCAALPSLALGMLP